MVLGAGFTKARLMAADLVHHRIVLLATISFAYLMI
jgi:hypothetical protein